MVRIHSESSISTLGALPAPLADFVGDRFGAAPAGLPLMGRKGRGVARPCRNHNIGAAPGQPQRNGAADAAHASRPGDESDLSIELHPVLPVPALQEPTTT